MAENYNLFPTRSQQCYTLAYKLMKIGIDARLWNETGVGRYIRNLIKQLAILDHENNYVLFAQNKDIENIKNQISNAKNTWKIIPVDMRWHSVEEQWRFPSKLYQERLDVMHFPYFSLPIQYNRPFIVTIHDLIIYHFPTGKASTLPLPLYHLKHYAYKAVIRQAIKKAVKVIVPLQAVKDDLQKTFSTESNKIIVTNEGIDEDLLKNKTNKEFHPMKSANSGQYFLYVGNAYPHKNLSLLINAFKKVYDINRDVTLILAGKKDFFYQRVEAEIKNNKYKNIIIYYDISDKHLADLYVNALAVVAPSFMEGFGLVPLEAMANNCLVFASAIPSHKEVCADAAMYFNPNKPDELYSLLKNRIINPADPIFKDKQILGKKRCSDYSWEKMAEETIRIYEQSAE